MLRVLVLALGLGLMDGSALAQTPTWFFCYAPDPATRTTYVSTARPVGPVGERAGYGQSFSAFLRASALTGASAPAYCVMRPSLEELQHARALLASECQECAGATAFRDVAWSRKAGAAGTSDADRPFEIAAPLPELPSIRLPPEQNAFVQVHTRFFACGDEIRMAYSLRPVPERGVTAVPFRGVLTLEGRPQRFDVPAARMSPGHRLGCGAQTVKVGELGAFAPALVSGRFSDGKVMWSRTQMIEQLLGRMHVFAVDPVPLQTLKAQP